MSVDGIVVRAGTAARDAHASLAAAGAEAIQRVLASLASRPTTPAAPVLEANAADVAAAQGHLAPALVDRLRLDPGRLEGMSGQLAELAGLPDPDPHVGTRALPGGLVVHEVRRPVGVIGANYEARQ